MPIMVFLFRKERFTNIYAPSLVIQKQIDMPSLTGFMEHYDKMFYRYGVPNGTCIVCQMCNEMIIDPGGVICLYKR